MDKKYENGPIPTPASTYIDAALDSWDKKKSKLATEYLGRNIRKELNHRETINPLYPRVAILGTINEQPEFVKNILAAWLEDIKHLTTMSAWGAEVTPAFGWCAQQLNLTGYQKIFDQTHYDARFGTPKASVELLRYVTGENPPFPGYLGTIEEPSRNWKPISSLNFLLGEMTETCLYRRYPIANDWGWTEEQYDQELDTNAQFIRARLGLPLKMPSFPEDPAVIVPAGFTHLPPVKTWKNEIFGDPV